VAIPLAPLPSVSVVSINGSPAPSNPAAGYTTPDVSINNATTDRDRDSGRQYSGYDYSQAADFVLRARLPCWTKEVSVTLNAQLQATANVTFPTGVSRFYIRANW